MAASLIRSGKAGTLRDALPWLRDRIAEEAGAAGVEAVLKPYLAVYPQRDRNPAEWAAFWAAYAAACGHLSREALRAGMQAWLEKPDSQWMPMPGELRLIAGSTPTEAHQLHARAKAILDECDRQAEKARIEADIAARGTTKERQAREIREMLVGLKHDLGKSAEQQRKWMKGADRSIAFPKRVRVPKGPLNEIQKDILRRCGKDV